MTPAQLTPLEIAAGVVLEDRPRHASLPRASAARTPRAALEAAVLPSLTRPPCLVSFSGGRDSSALLAVAVHVARREGLPLPIPATNRFPEAEHTIETTWQEAVVRHLRLDDWVRLRFAGELDCVGPVAARALRRHGLLWPCNVHFHAPILEAAAGGAVLTGIGGDEALSPSPSARAVAVATGRARPVPRDVLRLGHAAAPAPVKRRIAQRRMPASWGWLRPSAHRAVTQALATRIASEPVRYRRGFASLVASAAMSVGLASLDRLAADAGAAIAHPLHEPAFLAALAALAPGARPRSRTEGVAMLAGDLLPAAVCARETKASFDGAFWNVHSRALVARWNGEGLDAGLVDADALRRVWTSPAPDPRSFTLLQSVLLGLDAPRPRSSGGELEHALGRRGEILPAPRPRQLPTG